MTKRKPLAEVTDIPSRFAEIDGYFSDVPERQDGDLDIYELAEHWKVKSNQARRRMIVIAQSGEFDYLLVRDPARKNTIRVLRKSK